ncbi:uncharacterized protein LOC130994274 [Salvia miltiorrhiza]|uniref:uncharacterized protein LOC130994274 n=1 Tax=Salvia miltiorrhiza TaxID=226208 RepID=UPI0025ABE24E|nr:uncharacterized protein LOC130994274 [Salvia miltiorrhiza]
METEEEKPTKLPASSVFDHTEQPVEEEEAESSADESSAHDKKEEEPAQHNKEEIALNNMEYMGDFTRPIIGDTNTSAIVFPTAVRNYNLKPIDSSLLPLFHGMPSEDALQFIRDFCTQVQTIPLLNLTDDQLKLKCFPKYSCKEEEGASSANSSSDSEPEAPEQTVQEEEASSTKSYSDSELPEQSAGDEELDSPASSDSEPSEQPTKEDASSADTEHTTETANQAKEEEASSANFNPKQNLNEEKKEMAQHTEYMGDFTRSEQECVEVYAGSADMEELAREVEEFSAAQPALPFSNAQPTLPFSDDQPALPSSALELKELPANLNLFMIA